MMVEFTKEAIEQLSKPMPRGMISIKPGGVKKDGSEAMILTYVDSRAVQMRLDELFPGEWSFDWETAPAYGEQLGVKGILTICGVTRSDVGQANKEDEPYKSAVSDALKRCAVLFGVGRYLYDLPAVWWPGKRGSNDRGFYFDRPWDAIEYMESVIEAVAAGKPIPKSPAKEHSSDSTRQPPKQAPKQSAPSGDVPKASEAQRKQLSEQLIAKFGHDPDAKTIWIKSILQRECKDIKGLTISEWSKLMTAIHGLPDKQQVAA